MMWLCHILIVEVGSTVVAAYINRAAHIRPLRLDTLKPPTAPISAGNNHHLRVVPGTAQLVLRGNRISKVEEIRHSIHVARISRLFVLFRVIKTG